MVCSLGSGRMAVMARFLAAGRFSPTIAGRLSVQFLIILSCNPLEEDTVHQKSTAEYVCRELRDAVEANLLDEEDMHVYGLKPMSDPLQLVCCNICKKPIKSSQYAVHAELCRSLKFTEQTIVELDGSMGSRKPPRKEKKKFSTSCANQATVGVQERSASMDASQTAGSQSHIDSQIKVPSFSIKPKDAASMMDRTGINHRDHLASVMHPPKRLKLIPCAHLPSSENPGTISVKTKTASFPDGITRRVFLERAVPEGGDPINSVVNCKIPVLPPEKHVMKKDFPAPLATKIYYSQRNNRLRAALSHLYFEESSKELCPEHASPNLSKEEIAIFQDSSQRDPSEQHDDELNKMSYGQTLCYAQTPGLILAKSPENCTNKAGGLPSGSLSSLDDNVLRPAATPVGLTKSSYLPRSYSFTSKTGNPLGPIQQPNGKVPVV